MVGLVAAAAAAASVAEPSSAAVDGSSWPSARSARVDCSRAGPGPPVAGDGRDGFGGLGLARATVASGSILAAATGGVVRS